MRTDLLIALTLALLVGSALSQPPASPTIRLGDLGSIQVVGFNPARLPDFHSFSQDDWRSLFPIYTGSTWPDDNRPPLLGHYEVSPGVIRFLPTFPFAPGVSVVARFHAGKDRSPIQALLTPPFVEKDRTIVSDVFPTGDVPENLLKLYLHFSAPMRRTGVYEHIHLIDEHGERIEAPFVEVDPPLWDRETRRLTLIFEPGRIKRGLRQHAELGLSLAKNTRFSLVVAPGMRDATGQTLGTSHEVRFSVIDADRRSPTTKDWKIHPPEAGTRQPLAVELDESLDHALLQSMIDVYDTTGFVEGSVALVDNERVWRFTPREPWHEGTCELRINVLLEDLAGNRLDRLFDVDMMATEEQSMEDIGEWVTRRFTPF